jgi:molybdopterin-guanine dinucleotide biosynthesis protein A
VVVTACDQPDLTGPLVANLIAEIAAGAVAAVAETPDGRRHPLPVAWRADQAPWLEGLVAGGARRADAPLAEVAVATVPVSARSVADLDTPEEVASRREGAP